MVLRTSAPALCELIHKMFAAMRQPGIALWEMSEDGIAFFSSTSRVASMRACNAAVINDGKASRLACARQYHTSELDHGTVL